MMSQSGQQIAKDNIAKFQNWVAERESASDWKCYLRNDKLNRSEIAAECDFSLSVLRQNPAVKKALQDLEKDLLAREIINPSQNPYEVSSNEAEVVSEQATDKRIMAASRKFEARVKALEEQNAALRAEIGSLRDKLRRFEHLDEHLGRTARLLPE